MRRLILTAALAGAACLTLGGVGAARQDAKKDADKKADAGPKFDPKDVQVGPPPELADLRAAVEAAARKGENVDEVRAKLEALEKALAGKAWVRPKAAEPAPVPDPAPIPVPEPPLRRPVPRVQPLPFPDVNPGRRAGNDPDLQLLLQAQGLMLEAAQLMAEDPNNRERAEALRKRAEAMLMRALLNGPGGGNALPPQLFDPLIPQPRGGNGRLGIRVSTVAPGVAEDNKVPAGRGVLAAEVVPGSAAAKAGVKANDIIVEFAGQPVTDEPAAFVAQVQRAKAGDKLDMTVIRDGERQVIRGIVLAAAAAQPDPRAELFRELAPIVGADGRPLVEGLRRGRVIEFPDAPRAGVNVEVRDGEATVTAEENGVRYRIVGTTGPDGLVPTKIEVTENGRTAEAASVDRLPEQYRDRVRH